MLVRICAAVLLVLVTGATAQVNDTNDASESLTQRYNGYMASTMRRRHFYVRYRKSWVLVYVVGQVILVGIPIRAQQFPPPP